MKATRQNPFILTALAGAVLLAFGPARGQDNSVAQLAEPQSSISVGVGYVDKDNQRFGQYTGLTDKGGYGIVDFSLIRRDDSTGTWFKLQGRNLGFKDPDLHLEQRRQGDWGYSVDYSRIPRYDPFTVNTGLQGLGTTTQTSVFITPGTGADYHLKTVRDRWTVGLQKAINGAWDVKVRYRNEKKDGSRLFGQGHFGNAWRFLTDVLDQTTQQIDAMGEYTTERLQLRVGYYGTSFTNNNSLIITPEATSHFPNISLPPSNQSHQFYVTGGYNFTNATRGTFKASYSTATQNEAWPTPSAVAPQGSLDGRVDTTLLQGGLSGRLTPKFSWRADLRYRNRDDKTPRAQYWPNDGAPPADVPMSYVPRSLETTTGKVVGHYSLPMGFRLTGDLTYEQKKRNTPPVSMVNFRETTHETTYRIELRRAVSQTVTGAVSYLHSKRGGSDWMPMVETGGGPALSSLVAPLYMADRDRDTVRLVVNWMPTDPLSLNFRVDESRDDYKGRGLTPYDVGPREGRGSNYSVDAAYVFSDRVSGTAWYSSNENRYKNASCRDSVTNNVCDATDARPVWSSDLRNIADSYGLGLRSAVGTKIHVGADLVASKVRDEMNTLAIDPVGASAVVPLPDIHTKVTSLQLYGKYALTRQSGLRVDYIYDRYQTDDWTWANWIYPDGTTILQDPDQKVNFVGVSYYYKFQ